MTGRELFRRIDKLRFITYILGSLYGIYVYMGKIFVLWEILIKYCYYKRVFKSCGSNVSIHPDVRIIHPDKISVGNNVSIHSLCYIDGEGGIVIGNNVSIAHNVSILSFNHTWEEVMSPIKYNPKSYKSVLIADDVWIGCGSRLMAGVKISNRCIIASGSVVTKDCESHGLYAGIPAKLIKKI